MFGKVTMIAGAALFLCIGAACADDFDDCDSACKKTQQECIDGITLFDATGIAEAKAACVQQGRSCNQTCHEIDAMSTTRREEMQKKQAEEAERKRQEEQQAANGGIKTYDNDNGIKTYVFQ